MFFNYCKICSVRNSFIINNNLQMNKQNTKGIFPFLCFAIIISLLLNKETKYSLNVKSPHLRHIIHQCIKLYLYIGYLKLYTKILGWKIILQENSVNEEVLNTCSYLT